MIEFSARQLEIVDIVQKNEPITAEQIAEMLGVSKAALRSDLAVLAMTGYIDAKPKVGYFRGSSVKRDGVSSQLNKLLIKDIQGVPVIVQETTTVHDAVIQLFLENVGTLMVVDSEGYLEGIVSRKDLLKVTLGNPNASTMPVNLVMTRQPNVVTASPDDTVLEAARKMVHFQVDSLPVVQGDDKSKLLVTGRITKTNMTQVLVDLAMEV
ncbi:helix-turn-helix transcriptional regulator [Radiobacillus kanasensis]|uniref:helix-turn-helix transcriptional regulator n=1 Tax=Radiobacillus kanasensis TaxID=2844358 RepID=UPI001E34BC16|nr:helix-turn-helix transcriptional regulator [Radiobacillus kanasensis]UFU00775.1 helix-turn-helix transcriptional regulator [Radiobacillus kanasensis]